MLNFSCKPKKINSIFFLIILTKQILHRNLGSTISELGVLKKMPGILDNVYPIFLDQCFPIALYARMKIF